MNGKAPSARVLDVSEYLLQQKRPISAMKLQKLVYYCQAWSLAWCDVPMFAEPIQAWQNGPVVRALYDAHKGQYQVWTVGGDPEHLSPESRSIADIILTFYGDKSAMWLSDLMHAEDPWRNARRGLPDTANTENEITLESMMEYYTGLSPADALSPGAG